MMREGVRSVSVHRAIWWIGVVTIFVLMTGRWEAQQAAPVDQLRALLQEATALRAQENPGQAKELLDRVQRLDSLTSFPPTRDVGVKLLAIASALLPSAEYQSLGYVFNRAIQILETSPDGRPSDLVAGLYNLAAIYDRLENEVARTRTIGRIIDLAAHAPDPVDVDSATIFLALGNLLIDARQYEPAAILYSSVHTLIMERSRNDAAAIEKWLGLYSSSLISDGQCDKAVTLFDKLDKAPFSPFVRALERCGALLLQDQRPADAARYLQRALALRDSTTGQTAKETADTLSVLATAHLKSDQFADASGEYWRAITLRRSVAPTPR